MLFGGESHDTYLVERDSILNEFGPHGSSFRRESILNSFSPYGSPFSRYSACNPLATDPPVIVDNGGKFHGRLTVNQTHRQRTTNEQFQIFIRGICAGR